MQFNPIQLLIFILVFIPGYIFIHFHDYFLLKGEKSQFEKTVQVLLCSTIIWIIYYFLPIFYPITKLKKELIDLFILLLLNKDKFDEYLMKKFIYLLIINYFFLCFYTLIISCLWGYFRKKYFIDLIIRKFTGRDYFKTVSLRFYTENIGATIAVNLKNNKKYIGILSGAPDDINDSKIIISNPSEVTNNNFKKLAAKNILINLNETTGVEVIKKYERGKFKWQKKKKKKLEK